MVISFGGLATGLDTNAIIKAIMDAERVPLERMEKEKKYLSSRLEAFSQFETKLDALSSAIGEMNNADKLGSFATRSGSEEFFLTDGCKFFTCLQGKLSDGSCQSGAGSKRCQPGRLFCQQ